MYRRIVLSLLALVSMVAVLLVPGSASAVPVSAPVTCAASGTLTPSGLLFTLVPTLGDPIVQFMQTAELPIPIPMDFTATPEIYPGGDITYEGSFTIDVSTAVTQLVDDFLRPALVEAGYPDLAASAYVVLDLTDLHMTFPHPAGTTGLGTPVVTGSGVTAAHIGDEMVLTIDQVKVDSRVASPPVDIGATFQVEDGGTVPPATITQGVGTLDFDLALTFGGSAVFPPIPFAIPVSGTVSGPWGCTPDDPPPVLATTDVVPVPFVVPDAPTGVIGIPGDTEVAVAWSPPASDGGTPVTGYTVTADPDGATCATAGTGCVVAGLTNGLPYTFTVTATNEVGTGPPSEPSLPVVPTGCGPLLPGPFPDVPGEHPFCADIEWLAVSGVTTGFVDGTFRPAASVTRQSMAAFLYRFAGEPAFTPPVVASFPDVPTNHPFFAEIEWLAETEITGGFDDGTFRPASPVTRQSMAAFLYRFDGEPAFTPPGVASFPDVPTNHPFFLEIEWLADTGVTGGFDDGTFRPTSAVTRQAMAAFLHRYDAL